MIHSKDLFSMSEPGQSRLQNGGAIVTPRILRALDDLFAALASEGRVASFRRAGRPVRDERLALYAAAWADMGHTRREIGAAIRVLSKSGSWKQAIDAVERERRRGRLRGRKPGKVAAETYADTLRSGSLASKDLRELGKDYIDAGRARERLIHALQRGEGREDFEQREYWSSAEQRRRFLWFMETAIAEFMRQEGSAKAGALWRRS